MANTDINSLRRSRIAALEQQTNQPFSYRVGQTLGHIPATLGAGMNWWANADTYARPATNLIAGALGYKAPYQTNASAPPSTLGNPAANVQAVGDKNAKTLATLTPSPASPTRLNADIGGQRFGNVSPEFARTATGTPSGAPLNSRIALQMNGATDADKLRFDAGIAGGGATAERTQSGPAGRPTGNLINYAPTPGQVDLSKIVSAPDSQTEARNARMGLDAAREQRTASGNMITRNVPAWLGAQY